MFHVFVISVLLLMSCSPSEQGLERITLSSRSEKISLWGEIADDPSEQQQGLMERTELGKDRGMLFIFPKEQPISFWMKNTRIPLDVLFFDAEGKYLGYHTMDPCLPTEAPSGAKAGRNDPCPTFPSARPAKYALEVNAGFVEERGVGEGWTLEMESGKW